jgi:hypothetical protein
VFDANGRSPNGTGINQDRYRIGFDGVWVTMMFIVQGKPREPEGIVKRIRATRKEALEAAIDFQCHGLPFVTIVADGRVYSLDEFAETSDALDGAHG